LRKCSANLLAIRTLVSAVTKTKIRYGTNNPTPKKANPTNMDIILAVCCKKTNIDIKTGAAQGKAIIEYPKPKTKRSNCLYSSCTIRFVIFCGIGIRANVISDNTGKIMNVPIIIKIIPNISDNGLTSENNSIVKPLHTNNPIIVTVKKFRKIPETSIITHWKINRLEGWAESPLEEIMSLFMIRKIVKGIIGKRQGDKAT